MSKRSRKRRAKARAGSRMDTASYYAVGRFMEVLHLMGGAAVRPLSSALARADLSEAQGAIAYELGLLADRRAVAALTSALEDKETKVGSASVLALGWIVDPSSLSKIAGAVRDPVYAHAKWRAHFIQNTNASMANRRFLQCDNSLLDDNAFDLHPDRSETYTARGQERLVQKVSKLAERLEHWAQNVDKDVFLLFDDTSHSRSLRALGDVRELPCFVAPFSEADEALAEINAQGLSAHAERIRLRIAYFDGNRLELASRVEGIGKVYGHHVPPSCIAKLVDFTDLLSSDARSLAAGLRRLCVRESAL